jgi:hypothetical protein
MTRQTGYLASITLIPTLPPLIFRFQFNPDLLSEKKSYRYKEANGFGSWAFDQTAAGTGFIGTLTGLANDVKEIGSLLIATKPLEPECGDQRTFSIDFSLDATVPGPMDGSSHYGGSIEPDLAVLRAFMVPAIDVVDVAKMIFGSTPPCLNTPPPCILYYGGLSVECVMTDLNIKVTSFQDDGTASRADVSVSLKEQSFSTSPIVEYIKRTINIAKSYDRQGIGSDFLATTPIVNLFS